MLRAAIASNGADRPLPFDCEETTSAIDAYLAGRAPAAPDTVEAASFRGLDPAGRLFLSRDGRPLRVRYAAAGARQAVCKEIHDIYRRIFGHSGVAGINTACARRMAALRLQARGASTQDIAYALGVKRPAVLQLLKATARLAPPRQPPAARAPLPLARAQADANMDLFPNRDMRRQA